VVYIDTLKELIEGLYIYDKWDWEVKYPVVKISWAGADFQTLENLYKKAKRVFASNQERLGVTCSESDPNSCFDELIQKTYKNYWFATGTPTYLIKLIEQNNYFLPKLSSLVVDEKLLDSFDIENIDLEVILYQSGYLTIEEVKEKRYFEKYQVQNKEIFLVGFEWEKLFDL